MKREFFASADNAFRPVGLELGPDGALSIIPTLGWERFRGAEAWGRPFSPPSPNMPTLEAARVYPGGCLVEGDRLPLGIVGFSQGKIRGA